MTNENTTIQKPSGDEPLPFVPTTLAKRIWRTVNSARRYNRFAFVFGESQIGKTSAIEEYAARNSENTILVRMPTSPTLSRFVRRLSDICGVPNYLGYSERQEFILRKIRKTDVIIVDEAHQAICTEKRINPSHAKIFEFIRELHDTTRCGVCLVATNVLQDAIESGRLAGVLKQTVRRSTFALLCPDEPLREDLAAFSAAYGLQAASGEYLALQSEVIRTRGLGMWLTTIRMACALAESQKRALGWGDIAEAAAKLKQIGARKK